MAEKSKNDELAERSGQDKPAHDGSEAYDAEVGHYEGNVKSHGSGSGALHNQIPAPFSSKKE